MNLLKFTRYSEWWEYKLIPLVAIGYATITMYSFPVEKSILRLVFLLLAIICGAIYVSVINDITDITEDAAAGKRNNMADLTIFTRAILPCLCLIVGIVFSYCLFYPDWLSLGCYALAYLAFSLYSIPPLRLKKRGFWGVICDSSGAHLFPTLIISLNLIYYFTGAIDFLWFLSIGIWAFLYGLRGILWHQFYDRENDLKSGTNTFASKLSPEKFKTKEVLIFVLECVFISLVIYKLSNIWVYCALVLYIVLVILRRVVLKYQISFIVTPKNAPYQLLLNDFYLVFLPISLLLYLTFNQQYGWLMFTSHILLFPTKLFAVLKDYILLFKTLLVRLSGSK